MPRREDVDGECDRCGVELEGFRVFVTQEEVEEAGGSVAEDWEGEDEIPIGTAGFYKADSPPWDEITDEDEEYVCDDCMLDDPRYQDVYGLPS